ncbi:unnamed protein product [Heligmosomoides polygyrus]|uniref:ULP_PROTEASE domain-containing protein n=1 Tax=Heligmosomoides polygyrus TaxID=6339 RepID=A0A183G2G2_HELPZ|nr:unnamed protein product [Heligmosomoides polygyrus]
MSYSEELECRPALEDHADSRSQSNRGKQRKGDALLQKKLADQVFVTKTLHDPANTLSKASDRRAKKRLEQENGPDNLQTGVPYSLNKQERWKTVNSVSLLDSRSDCGPEVLVVNRVITPTHSRDVENLNVSSVHLDDNDELTRISVKGKGHKFSYFGAALKERRNVDKDEPEPARILFNVVEPHPVASILAGKTQRSNGRGAWSSKSRYNDYRSDDDLNDVDSEDEEVLHEADENTVSPSSVLTLGDFMKESSSSQVPFRSRLKDSYSWSMLETETEDPARESLGNPVATPATSKVESVFEVVDISTRRWLKRLNLQETHEQVTIRWINAERVMVDASYLVKNSPHVPLDEPLLVLFFEVLNNSCVLRVRVNANTRFVGANDREAFVFILKKQHDFFSIFNTILEFVRDMRLQELGNPKVDRCTENPGYFAAEVNSEATAVKAERCNEYDRMAFLREMECASDIESSETEKPSSTCHRCNSQSEDLFPTKDGSTCRECVAAVVLRQLNRNDFPIDIPLLPSMSCSRIESLYAVLPVPAMSKLIEGYRVTVEKVAPVKLIAKEFASRCTEARNLRFSKEKRTDFEKRALLAEKPKLVHLRRTTLVLVENCTAWLYLHRSERATHRPHKLAVSHLLQQFLSLQVEATEDVPSTSFDDKVEELKKTVQKVLDLFKTATRRSEE